MSLERARALAEERHRSRVTRHFARADQLRELIKEEGYEVVDTAEGPELRPLEPGAPLVYRRSTDVPSLLAGPPRFAASIQWVVEGWPEDVHRGIDSVRRTCDLPLQLVVVDMTGTTEDWAVDDVVRFAPEAGWAAARNAGLRRSAGRIVVVVDGSVEATGDIVAPLVAALEDPRVGVTGPFGITSEDLHHFHESDGPEVDAIEGYLMGFRRSLVQDGVGFDEGFKFYRTADIELSFRVKSRGLTATITPVPAARHEHRMWANTPAEERERRSKRNFYRFLDRWRGRKDLLVSREG